MLKIRTLPYLFLLSFLFGAPELLAGEIETGNQDREKIYMFRFVPGDDMFYVPWENNKAEMERLYTLVNLYREEIVSGAVPIHVDAYSASMQERKRNLSLSYVRANRVKSELILHQELRENHFITRNFGVAYTDGEGNIHKNMVVVTLRIPTPKPTTASPTPAPAPSVTEEEPTETDNPFQAVTPIKSETESVAVPSLTISTAPVRGWYAGANIGMPFFWGDFTSTAADKTYIGIGAGIFGGYQFNPWIGVSLSLDYARNKTGHRDYAAFYILDLTDMTWYTPQTGTTARYNELYVKIDMFSIGLHADLNANRALGRRAASFPLKVIVSPAVYANTFSPKIYRRSDNKPFADRNDSKSLSLGLGGDVAVRYDLSPVLGVQLKGTGMWITDNNFDNIRTIGSVKQNAYWSISAGIVWRINNKGSY